MGELTPLSKAEQALAQATTPQESMAVEALAAAAKAWAKEWDDFDKVIKAWEIFIKARRKTTELIEPEIRHEGGRPPENRDINVTVLSDFGFTGDAGRKRWQRRCKELDVTVAEIYDYIDECVKKQTEPTIAGLVRKYTQIIGSTTGDEWYTPKRYTDSARKVMGSIDLDPASCAMANSLVGASTYYTKNDNGLAQPWAGNVFMNPPYSANKEFNEKMLAEYESRNVKQAVVLVGAHGIETQWFRPYWDHILCFTGHRIKFMTPDGPMKAGNISGSVFIYLGENQSAFAEEFNQHGFVVKRWP